MSSRWYTAWRHWGCATKHQIAGLKDITGNDPTKTPGYDRLSPESQEQVRLAFEEGKPVDKGFKGIREDLAKDARRYAKEYRDVSFYKVDAAGRACACRGGDCLAKNMKITKGELRLGLSVPFDGEYESMAYKHWQCMSTFDLEQVLIRAREGLINGVDSLPIDFKEVVTRTLETGKIVEPPERSVESLKKLVVEEETKREATGTTKARMNVEEPEYILHIKMEEAQGDDAVEVEGAAAPAPKPKAKKSRAKKRSIKEFDASSKEEPEYIPKKSRSRSVPFKGAVG